ncbi:MAG: LysR family transcriptional regulator, partial [Aeromonas veronii]
MKLYQIELFVESANSGSIANTARRLGKSRSAVSTSIAALEVELGVELFERGANQSRLTEIGELVLDDCTRLLQAANSLQQKCKHYASGAEVALRVARDDAIPEPVWREMLASLHNQFPGTSISLV